MRNEKKNGIIFDLDGTLWDASETIAPAWNEWLSAHGVNLVFTPADSRSCCGKTLPEIARFLFPEADPAWAEWVVNGCCEAECVPLAKWGGRLYPRTERVLAKLREEYFLAVVSNCGLGYIEAFFSGNGTGIYFDDYENAARTGLTKGENIRLVMERNGIARAVYVGDTEGDQAAAKAAGVPFIHAAYGYGKVESADAVVSRIADLPEVLDNLLK